MKGKYYYLPRFTWWNVYNESGTKVSEFRTKEEARKEVYRLNGWKKTLILTVHKKWFELICSGEKKEEYRKYSKWIESRLVGKKYDYVRFINGYGLDKPSVLVEYKGYHLAERNYTVTYSTSDSIEVEALDYVIELGNILVKQNIPNE